MPRLNEPDTGRKPRISIPRGWYWSFGLAAVVFIALAAVGGIRSYSPVPFWDMWDGFLLRAMQVGNGDVSALWSQYQQHRILWARLLFLADQSWFGGSGRSLIVVNYLLALMVALQFWLWARELEPESGKPATRHALCLFLTACFFSWSQYQNLTWGFQSQFFLAQLLPLNALYLLQKSMRGLRTRAFFAAACLAGILSVGAMSSCMLTLPLLTVYAVFMKQRWRRVLVLAGLSILMIILYLHDYQPVPGTGSLAVALRTMPLWLAVFILMYLGSPFHYVLLGWAHLLHRAFGVGSGSVPLFLDGMTVLVGVLFIVFTGVTALRVLRQPRQSPAHAGLLLFLIFVFLVAVATGGVRAVFGVQFGLQSRYTTPMLMAWAALLLLRHDTMALDSRRMRTLLRSLAACLVLMLPYQLVALHADDSLLFQRKVAALALELRAHDEERIWTVFPFVGAEIQSIADGASARNLSVFGLKPFRDLRERIAAPASAGGSVACAGRLESVFDIGDPRYLRVSGWMFDSARGTVPRTVALVNSSGVLAGYALTGQPRPDLRSNESPYAFLAGFEGYVLADETGRNVTLVGGDNECAFRAVVPQLFCRDSLSAGSGIPGAMP